MAKERFKDGDQVKTKDQDYGSRVWIVENEKVSTQYVYVYCKVNGEIVKTSFRPEELKHLPKNNQQLLFDFMKD